MDEFYLQRKSESSLLLQIEHLKDDNVRLLNMLRSTDQFKDFMYLTDDGIGGIRYIKTGNISNHASGGLYSNGCDCNDKPRGKCSCKDTKSKVPCRIKECLQKKLQEDSPLNDNNWVPVEAIECANNFKRKYNFKFEDKMLMELLSQINNVLIEKHRKDKQRLISKFQSEILDLRRKLNYTNSSQIIGKPNSSNAVNFTNTKVSSSLRSSTSKPKPSRTKGDVMVSNALQAANQFYKTKKDLESEITKLKKQLVGKETNSSIRENLERLKFNEGAYWISKDLVIFSQSGYQRARENLPGLARF